MESVRRTVAPFGTLADVTVPVPTEDSGTRALCNTLDDAGAEMLPAMVLLNETGIPVETLLMLVSLGIRLLDGALASSADDGTKLPKFGLLCTVG